jgi:hypothetical protein
MRFALLGDHADGLDMARALVSCGRHQLIVYFGSPVGREYLRRWGLEVPQVGDLEEVLADPAVEAVLVAGSPSERPAQLRRALQAERHVLCVHPADRSPHLAYEAALLQEDQKLVALPLLPEVLHPGVARLADWCAAGTAGSRLQRLQMERGFVEECLLEAEVPGLPAAFPGWEVLRRLGGDVQEVAAFAAGKEITGREILFLTGQFTAGGVFQVTLVPQQPEAYWQLRVWTAEGWAELLFPQGWPGPAQWRCQEASGACQEEHWDNWDPWPALVEQFEAALARRGKGTDAPAPPAYLLSWQEEIRCLELDEAARRSLVSRRSSLLEYPSASEETSFKGTMTLVGCSLFWLCLALLIASLWFPWAGWLIVPLLTVFLLAQLLRWLLPRSGAPAQAETPRRSAT